MISFVKCMHFLVAVLFGKHRHLVFRKMNRLFSFALVPIFWCTRNEDMKNNLKSKMKFCQLKS